MDRRIPVVIGLVNTAAVAVALMLDRTSSANILATIAFCSFLVAGAMAIIDLVRQERSDSLRAGGDVKELADPPVLLPPPVDDAAPPPGE
jgi:hypothetical protein